MVARCRAYAAALDAALDARHMTQTMVRGCVVLVAAVQIWEEFNGFSLCYLNPRQRRTPLLMLKRLTCEVCPYG